MIDLHCHILPGLDDGPGALDEALAMCRMAAGDGIRTIVATPHFRPGRFPATSSRVFAAITALEQELRREQLDLRILPGAEVTIFPELAARIEEEPHLTINAGKRYFLAEIPPHAVLPRWDEFLLSFLKDGSIPLLAHPERHSWFWTHPEAIHNFIVKGGMIQITAASLTGMWGDEPREFSELLLRHRMVHSIATDAHDAGRRRPVLSEAVSQAADLIGAEQAKALVTVIPQAIIDGRNVSAPGPLPFSGVPRKKTWIEKLVS